MNDRDELTIIFGFVLLVFIMAVGVAGLAVGVVIFTARALRRWRHRNGGGRP